MNTRFIILIMLIVFKNNIYSQNYSQIIHTNTRNISLYINGYKKDWTVSPRIKPDKIFVYSEKETNNVSIITTIDSCSWKIRENDTIKFIIVLKTDSAFTDIIGIKKIPHTISTFNKLFYLSLLWSEIKYNFVNIDKLDFNIDSIYNTFIPKIINTENDYMFYNELNRFTALMHDGHTSVSTSGQFSAFKDYIPIRLMDFNNKIHIVNIRKRIGIDSSCLGAEIIEINNIPTNKYLDSLIFPYINASTKQHLWMQGLTALQYDLKENPLVIKIKKKNDEVTSLNLKRNGETTRSDTDEYYGKFDFFNNIVDYKWLKDSIILIDFNSFYPENEAIDLFVKIVNIARKAKGIIINLRNNGGGSTEVGWLLQSYLNVNPQRYFLNFGYQTRINDGVKKANGNWISEYRAFYLNKAYQYFPPDTIFIPDSIQPLTIPIVILVSRYTFSAAEDFLVNIYELPNRPLIIGEPTGGSTGSPLIIENLPGGGYARICTRRICFPYSKKPFVNEGIIPDYIIYQSISDYLNDKDTVMEKAIEILNSKIKKTF